MKKVRRSSEDVQKERVKALKGENSAFRKKIKLLEARVLSLEKRVDKLGPKKSFKTKKEADRAKMLAKFHPDFNKD